MARNEPLVERWDLTEEELASIAALMPKLRAVQVREFMQRTIELKNKPRRIGAEDHLMVYGISHWFKRHGLPFSWSRNQMTGLYQIAVIRRKVECDPLKPEDRKALTQLVVNERKIIESDVLCGSVPKKPTDDTGVAKEK